jgi:hypothetical protein
MDQKTMRLIIADLKDDNIQVIPGTPETALRKTRKLVAHALQIILDADGNKPAQAGVFIPQNDYDELLKDLAMLAKSSQQKAFMEDASVESVVLYRTLMGCWNRLNNLTEPKE